MVDVVPSADQPAAADDCPRLRAVAPEWTQQDGRPMLLLRDPLRLTEQAVLVPQHVAVLLSLFDGRRTRSAIQAAYGAQTGLPLSAAELDHLIAQLDGLLLLDGPRFAAAQHAALVSFRAAPTRQPALAGKVYPADPAALSAQLDRWLAEAGRRSTEAPVAAGALQGVVCPHIDYGRGAAVYADLWRRAAPAVREADLILVFGTDHHGRAGSITPTYQRYATPRGVLANDASVIDALVAALGDEEAFAQELNHRDEHSIELAVIWIQHLLDGRSTPVVPILTGSFHTFTQEDEDAAAYLPFDSAIAALRAATRGRRVLVVAAADLAHMGPAFGDARPLNATAKAAVAAADTTLLAALCTGRPEAFLQPLLAEHDGRRVCGLPPVYLTLRYLHGAIGEVTGYQQCPADASFGSLVSIAGVLLHGTG